MNNDKTTKDYNWIILFFLIISAIIRLLMHIYEFTYVDYFISIINLIGFDYTFTTIINSINRSIEKIIDNSKIVRQAKINKKKKHKYFVYISILVLSFYNIIHLIFFSCSTANDMASMIVLGISLTDTSIVSFFVKNAKI